jgi:putative N-acetyltransferase (TIGR04045 family)
MNDFHCRIARTAAERDGYFELRRSIFCEEQGLFGGSDRDQVDVSAHPIVCLAGDDVVGVVRIWEDGPGLWWGGRLGVRRDHRTVGSVGRWLVRTAVGIARAWGARRFQATVQSPNLAFFRRLRWRSLEELELHGLVHHLMEADLDHYPPIAERRPGCSEEANDPA